MTGTARIGMAKEIAITGGIVSRGDYVEYTHPRGSVRHGRVMKVLPAPWYQSDMLFVEWHEIDGELLAKMSESNVSAKRCSKWDPAPLHDRRYDEAVKRHQERLASRA